jgi:hypothetical protein
MLGPNSGRNGDLTSCWVGFVDLMCVLFCVFDLVALRARATMLVLQERGCIPIVWAAILKFGIMSNKQMDFVL